MRALIRVALGFAILLTMLILAGWWWNALDRRRRQEAMAELAQKSREHSPRSVERMGTLPEILRESSGVAASRAYPGVLWSHNDSGDGPVLYAVDTTGRAIARFEVGGAEARDWEDIALGPCAAALATDGRDCLYIGDIGDNRRRRFVYSVWLIPEPDPRAGGAGSTERSWRVAFRYAEGARNAEALAVTPEGSIVIVTKEPRGPAGLFVIDSAAVNGALRSSDVLTLRSAGTLPIRSDRRIGRVVTGAAISPAGDRLVVRTYHELYFFRRDREGHLTPPAAPCFLGTLEPVGEAVDFLDEHTVVLTSETHVRWPGNIFRVRCD